jgi:hypothetical protein
MLVNFRAREINRNARKLARTPTLIKNIYIYMKIDKNPILIHEKSYIQRIEFKTLSKPGFIFCLVVNILVFLVHVSYLYY